MWETHFSVGQKQPQDLDPLSFNFSLIGKELTFSGFQTQWSPVHVLQHVFLWVEISIVNMNLAPGAVSTTQHACHSSWHQPTLALLVIPRAELVSVQNVQMFSLQMWLFVSVSVIKPFLDSETWPRMVIDALSKLFYLGFVSKNISFAPFQERTPQRGRYGVLFVVQSIRRISVDPDPSIPVSNLQINIHNLVSTSLSLSRNRLKRNGGK